MPRWHMEVAPPSVLTIPVQHGEGLEACVQGRQANCGKHQGAPQGDPQGAAGAPRCPPFHEEGRGEGAGSPGEEAGAVKEVKS